MSIDSSPCRLLRKNAIKRRNVTVIDMDRESSQTRRIAEHHISVPAPRSTRIKRFRPEAEATGSGGARPRELPQYRFAQDDENAIPMAAYGNYFGTEFPRGRFSDLRRGDGAMARLYERPIIGLNDAPPQGIPLDPPPPYQRPSWFQRHFGFLYACWK